MFKKHEGPVLDIKVIQGNVITSSFDIKIWDINNLEIIQNYESDQR